ncbi:hypothetical protein ACFVRD_40965 [Streptomyces sp. NPDC057908]|uniref:hypothetical protein n=1 Tax=Streptomyces sp. NPDC057908 TaxID=3346276 RepID=UPI0036E46A05
MAATALPATTIARAETYYVPPWPRPGEPPTDWSGVPGAELVYYWYGTRLSRRVPIPTETVPDGAPVYARIDDGRWLAECDICRNAIVVSVADLRYGCPECKRGWVELIAPDDVAAVEAETLAKPRRFWWHPDDPRNPYREEPVPEPPVDPEPPTEPEEPQP